MLFRTIYLLISIADVTQRMYRSGMMASFNNNVTQAYYNLTKYMFNWEKYTIIMQSYLQAGSVLL